MSLVARIPCMLFGGHDFTRYGDYLVCEYCGYKVKVGHK